MLRLRVRCLIAISPLLTRKDYGTEPDVESKWDNMSGAGSGRVSLWQRTSFQGTPDFVEHSCPAL
jgi:hypothetical protein